jgi:hypothetical protein
LGAPLLAHEASYLAASARMLSLSINCMKFPDTVFMYSTEKQASLQRHRSARGQVIRGLRHSRSL